LLTSLQSRFKDWVNREFAKQLDKEPFSSLPLRMRIGIFMLSGSWLIGYGAPIVLMIISGRNHQLASGAVKGSAVYVVCWATGFIGLMLAGRDSIKYPIYFLAKFLKILFPRYFKQESESN
jgi:phenolic acid decarboxylase